jgi:hypothetical protein
VVRLFLGSVSCVDVCVGASRFVGASQTLVVFRVSVTLPPRKKQCRYQSRDRALAVVWGYIGRRGGASKSKRVRSFVPAQPQAGVCESRRADLATHQVVHRAIMPSRAFKRRGTKAPPARLLSLTLIIDHCASPQRRPCHRWMDQKCIKLKRAGSNPSIACRPMHV